MSEIRRITIPRWFERHVHFRRGQVLKKVMPFTILQRAIGAVVMGNHEHPHETSTVEKARAYMNEMLAEVPEDSDFKPVGTCFLTDEIEAEEVIRGYEEGVWGAIKIYLTDEKGEGGTTNSKHGVRNLPGRYKVLEAAAGKKIPVLIHNEVPEDSADEFDREVIGLDRYVKPMLKAIPNMRLVIEHVGDYRVAEFVEGTSYNVRATVTIQTMRLNRNALFRGGLNPAHYCKPILKREEHRVKIRKIVMSGSPRFGAGTDSAPHQIKKKVKFLGCNAGMMTATNAVESYVELFDEDNALQHFPNFMSVNFLDWYGMKVSEEMMTLENSPTQIPERIRMVKDLDCDDDILVVRGGEILPWKLVS